MSKLCVCVWIKRELDNLITAITRVWYTFLEYFYEDKQFNKANNTTNSAVEVKFKKQNSLTRFIP